MTENECWLCLRVTPKIILGYSHKLFPHSPELAHEVGMEVAEMLKSIYLENPPALCGKTTKGLVGGALYIVCLLKNQRMTQREVAEACDVTEVAIRNSYQYIAKLASLTLKGPYRSITRGKYVCPIAGCDETRTGIWEWKLHLEYDHHITIPFSYLRVKDFDTEGNLVNKAFLEKIREKQNH